VLLDFGVYARLFRSSMRGRVNHQINAREGAWAKDQNPNFHGFAISDADR
jgi:hypothetical protein